MTSVSNYPALRGNFDSLYVDKENENQVFRLNGYTPVSYALHISSNTEYSVMSISEYLSKSIKNNNFFS